MKGSPLFITTLRIDYMKPPEEIPEELLNQYTLDGQIEVESKYLDNANEEIQAEFNANFTSEKFEEYLQMAKDRKANYYGSTDIFLYLALDKFPIKDKHVLIMGSANPWYEAVCVEYGAKKITVVEYSDRPELHSLVEYKKMDEVQGEQFDAAISISSFEHDGLGRYGDPLNPDGDFAAMADVRTMLKTGGNLFLAVPLGKDKLVWNAHRIYGSIRLPLLMRGWTPVLSVGASSDDVDVDTGIQADHQPVFVLQA